MAAGAGREFEFYWLHKTFEHFDKMHSAVHSLVQNGVTGRFCCMEKLMINISYKQSISSLKFHDLNTYQKCFEIFDQ